MKKIYLIVAMALLAFWGFNMSDAGVLMSKDKGASWPVASPP
jgi:hypothetical protein